MTTSWVLTRVCESENLLKTSYKHYLWTYGEMEFIGSIMVLEYENRVVLA